jgi:hypothetical protein
MVIERLTGSADVRSLWSRNWRLTTLHLDGLSIRILPRGDSGGSYIALQKRPGFQIPPIEFDEITSDDALLEILPSLKQGKPHTFRIHHLLLRSVARGQPAYFHAELTNPVPAGEIESEGTFGPWDPDEPGLTPVAANFIFANADLGQFRGISGHTFVDRPLWRSARTVGRSGYSVRTGFQAVDRSNARSAAR